VVGGMLIGPIMLLVVVPALQTLFSGGGSDAEAERPAEEAEKV